MVCITHSIQSKFELQMTLLDLQIVRRPRVDAMCVFLLRSPPPPPPQAHRHKDHRPRRSRALRRPLLPPSVASPTSCAPPPLPAFISHLLLPPTVPSRSLSLPSIDATGCAARRLRYGPPPSLSLSLSELRRPAASPQVRRVAFSSSWLRGPPRPPASRIAVA
jgi:hypothetical protein